MNILKYKAINLFLSFFNKQYKYEDIKIIKKIHHGFTNSSYFLELNNGQKFQIRIGQNNEIVDRINEKNVIDIINENDYLFYDINSGNAIKKWISGRTLKKSDLNINNLRKIFNEIEKYHNIKKNNLSNLLKHDYYIFLNNVKLNNKYLCIYKKIVDKISTTFWGFSHNDINLNNILLTNKLSIKLIDFEWARINHPYWDYANLIKETYWDFKKIKFFAKLGKLDLNLLLEMTFVAICFSYQWTFSNSFSLKILSYRLKMYFKMIFFYYLLKKIVFCR